MIHSIGTFSDWLSATALSQFIQNVAWIIPLVQSIHILLVATVMGSVIMFDLKLLGWAGAGMTVSDQLKRYGPWIWGALAVLLTTGTILTIAEPRRELLNADFITKMVLIATMALCSVVFQNAVKRNPDAWGDVPTNKVLARALAVASLLGWVAIVVCGRWIAYFPHG